MMPATRYYQEREIDVTDASPHRLIELLFEGALSRIARAKGAMQYQVLSEKGKYIGQAISIIGGLREGLDEEKGGEMATRLDDLYTYMQRRLLESNLRNDIDGLDEVARLLTTLKEGWDSIPLEFRNGVA